MNEENKKYISKHKDILPIMSSPKSFIFKAFIYFVTSVKRANSVE